MIYRSGKCHLRAIVRWHSGKHHHAAPTLRRSCPDGPPKQTCVAAIGNSDRRTTDRPNPSLAQARRRGPHGRPMPCPTASKQDRPYCQRAAHLSSGPTSFSDGHSDGHAFCIWPHGRLLTHGWVLLVDPLCTHKTWQSRRIVANMGSVRG